MNFCTKCQSIYSQPGTCNCFATSQPKFVPPAAPQPWYPPVSPTVVPYPYPWPGTTITWSAPAMPTAVSVELTTGHSVPVFMLQS